MLIKKSYSLHLILNLVGIIMFSTKQALATSCQTYPSEYAYHKDSVNRAESSHAKCRFYSVGPASRHQYIHCDGTQLELTDSNLGPEQYQATDYYWWPFGSIAQLLFIFPSRVSLTTITLHYYSDNSQGLSTLRFYAVSDNYNIWNYPNTSYPYVDVASVPPGGEPAGHRNVSINVNFNTSRVLMHKNSSLFQFAVSEVKFFICENATTLVQPEYEVNTTSTSSKTHNTPASSVQINRATFTESDTTNKDFTATKQSSVMPTNTSTSRTDTDMLRGQSKTVIIAIGVSTVLLLILSSAIVLTVVVLVWNYKRRSAKQELYTEHSYSTLSRGSEQSQSIHHNSTQFYDQVHLSPFTGQTEFIPKSESTNINNPSTTLQIFHPTLSTAGDDRAEHFSVLNTEHLETTPQLSSQTAYESTVICEQPTYAAVDKSKKEKIKKQTRKEDSKCKVTEKGFHVSSYRNEVSSASMQEKKEKAEEQVINPPHMIEELYTAVKKKPKGSEPKDEDKIPPMPPHTIEELYTAVEKKPRSNADENKEASPKTLNFVPEDLHTAVARKLEGGLTDGTEAAPPIPPHTVEELYTAVMKKPKGSAEDEEEAPPIPPYTVDEN